MTSQRPSCSRRDDPVGDRAGLLAVVGDVQPGDAHLLEQAAEVEGEAVVELAVEGAERLVEQQQAGRRGERPGQRHPLGLAAGQRGHAAALEARRARRGRAARPPAGGSRPGVARPPQPEADVAGDVAVGEQLVVLEHQPEAPAVGGHVREVLAVPRHAAGVGDEEAGDHPQQRALARPARPEQADDLPGADGQADLVEHHPVAEPDGHPVDLEHRTPRVPRSPPRRRAGDRRRGSRRGCSTISMVASAYAWARLSRARSPEQPGDGDRHRLVADPGEEAGRAELAERDGEGEAGAGHERPAQEGQVDLPPHPRRRGAERRRGVAETGVDGAQRRQHGPDDERHGDQGVGDGDEHPRAPAGRAGARSNVMSRPKPTVTADVPSGSIRPVSRSGRPGGRRRWHRRDAADRRRRRRSPAPRSAARCRRRRAGRPPGRLRRAAAGSGPEARATPTRRGRQPSRSEPATSDRGG